MVQDISGKTIVPTGTMQPAKFRFTDAILYIVCAITVVQAPAYGVYIAINSQVLIRIKIERRLRKIALRPCDSPSAFGHPFNL